MNNDTLARKLRAWLISVLLDRIDDRVTALIDEDAVRRGWTVQRLPDTRTRVYRDPRWDSRHICDCCLGSGLDGARSCSSCDGSGVVTETVSALLPGRAR